VQTSVCLSTRQQIKFSPGYQLSFPKQVKAVTGLLIIAVGLITEPEHA